MTTTTTETTTTEPTILDKLHAKWKEGGEKKPDKKEAARLLADLKKAHDAKGKAEEALTAARKLEHAAVEAIVLAKGKGAFKTPEGVKLTPMSKAGSLFMRTEGQNVDTFGA